MHGRGPVAVAGAGIFLMTASLAAADRCHTPLPGTRSLTLSAEVVSYRLAGDRVVVNWKRTPSCRGILVWNYTARAQTVVRIGCAHAKPTPAAPAAENVVASDSRHTVRIIRAPPSADMPDRLVTVIRATGRRVASWPLPMRASRVALHGGIAVLSGATREALYALRISDGRIAQIGIARAGDRPKIGPAGVLYQDDLDRFKHRTAPAERTLKLVPLAAVREELARPFSTVRKYMSYSTVPKPATSVAATSPAVSVVSRTRYRGADPPRPFRGPPITAMSMDGARVALAVRDPKGRCDYVLFWNVLWHYVTRLTRASGQTCLPVHEPGGITNVAIAGSRAAWTVTYGRKTRVLAADITDCQEWVVARPAAGERVGLAGDGAVLAYATAPRRGVADSTVGVVPDSWQGAPIAQIASSVIALSVDGDRVAALDNGGTVSITTVDGEPSMRLPTRDARAISLRDSRLVALRESVVDVYSATTGARVRSWKVPANATSVDLHYRTAVITAGRSVYALNTATGRIARIFRGPSRVFAQLEAPGAAIVFTRAGRASLRFVPMSRIESSTS